MLRRRPKMEGYSDRTVVRQMIAVETELMLASGLFIPSRPFIGRFFAAEPLFIAERQFAYLREIRFNSSCPSDVRWPVSLESPTEGGICRSGASVDPGSGDVSKIEIPVWVADSLCAPSGIRFSGGSFQTKSEKPGSPARFCCLEDVIVSRQNVKDVPTAASSFCGLIRHLNGRGLGPFLARRRCRQTQRTPSSELISR